MGRVQMCGRSGIMGTRCAAKHNNGHTLGFCVNIIFYTIFLHFNRHMLCCETQILMHVNDKEAQKLAHVKLLCEHNLLHYIHTF